MYKCLLLFVVVCVCGWVGGWAGGWVGVGGMFCVGVGLCPFLLKGGGGDIIHHSPSCQLDAAVACTTAAADAAVLAVAAVATAADVALPAVVVATQHGKA